MSNLQGTSIASGFFNHAHICKSIFCVNFSNTKKIDSNLIRVNSTLYESAYYFNVLYIFLYIFLNRNKKYGTPTIATTTPTGISIGGWIPFAKQSLIVSNKAPIKPDIIVMCICL